MKLSIYTISLFVILMLNGLYAGDGNPKDINDVDMNINRYNYVLFEDGNIKIFSRRSDEKLVEITSDYELYVEGELQDLNWEQEELIEEYYFSIHRLLTLRGKIVKKGLEIGLKGAKMGLKAVGGVFELIASGFDEEAEKAFEDKMEMEADRLELEAEGIEEIADEYEYHIYQTNNIEKDIRYEIKILDNYDLYIDEEELDINIE